VEANHGGLFRLTTSSAGNVVKTTVIDEGIGDPSGPLDRALGRHGTFIGGYGVAAGPGGVTFADTPSGDGWSKVSALVEVSPNGSVKALWRS
jgi:hypothetical protein